MAKINTEKEDIKRYVNEANRRLGTDRSFICEKREKFVKWLRDNMPIEAKQLLIMKRDVEAREYVKEIIDEITAPDE